MDLIGRHGLLGRSPLLRGRRGRKRRKSLDNKTRLLIGAGGLLLFIVGLKRSYRLEQGDPSVRPDGEPDAQSGPADPSDRAG